MTVKTKAQKEQVEEEDATHFIVSVKALPIEGKANEAVRRALAGHLGVLRSALLLRSGATGKRKVFELQVF